MSPSFDSDSPMATAAAAAAATSTGANSFGLGHDYSPSPSYTPAAIYGTDPVQDHVSVSHQRQRPQQYKSPEAFNSQHQLQVAPSQQRGIPQRYHSRAKNNRYQAENENENTANRDDDEEPRQHSPSNTRQSQEGYQMGAYLGPSMDDKELNGVFNSNNDDRDDVDSGPGSGYDEGASELNGLQKQQSAQQPMQNYGASNTDDNSDLSPFSSGQKSRNNYNNQDHSSNLFNGNDEESADEDDVPDRSSPSGSNDDYPRRAVQQWPELMANRDARGRRPAASSAGVKGARKMTAATSTTKTNTKAANNANYYANQYNNNNDHSSMLHDGSATSMASTGNSDDSDDQERKIAPRFNSNGQLMAAANGYAPFGYGASGPVDLGSMLAGLTGAPNNQGYQVYQGDGSNYPGQAYYNQQGNNQNNGRQQLARQASSRNNYNNNNVNNAGYLPQLNGYGPQQQNDQQQQFNADTFAYPRSNPNNGYNNNRDQRENRDTNEDNDNEGDED